MSASRQFHYLCMTLLAIGLFSASLAAHAQEGYRFQPPRAPPMDLDEDFDDEDALEMGDDYPRLPGTYVPPNQGQAGFAPPNNSNNFQGGGNDFRPPPRGRETSAKDFRFQIVEGEYWEKGKKRTRGAKTHVSSAGSNKKR